MTRRRPALRRGLAALLAGSALAPAAASAEPATALSPLSIRAGDSTQEQAGLRSLSGGQLHQRPDLSLEQVLLGRADLNPFRLGGSARLHPTAQGLSLRGLSPNSTSRTRVLLDGIPLNDAFAGWVHWQQLPEAWVQQVEIDAGAGGLSVGALSGRVELFTRLPAADEPRLRLGVGSDGQRQADASTALDLGNSRLGLYASSARSDGEPILGPAQAGAIDVAADRRQSLARLQWQGPLSAGLRWQLAGHYSEQHRGNGTPLTDNRHRGLGISGGLDWLGPTQQLELRLWRQDESFASRFSAQAEDRSTETPALDQFSVPARTHGLTSTWRHQAGAHQWRVGVEVRETEAETREYFRFLDGAFRRYREAGSEERQWGLYVEDHWQTPWPAWSLLTGLRLDQWQLGEARRRETERADGQLLREERAPARRGEHLSPRLALIWQTTSRWQLRLEGYRSMRLPSINERVRPFRIRNDITEANASLRPERLTGAELASLWTADGLQLQASLFWLQLDNAIGNRTVAESSGGVIAPCGFVPAGGRCSQRDNLGRIDNHGLELDARWQAGAGVTLGGSAVFSNPTIGRAPDEPALVGRRVAQQPRQSLSLDIRRHWSQQQLQLAWRYYGSRFEDDRNQQTLAASRRWDLGWQWQWRPALQLYAGIDNLLDERHPIAISGSGLVSLDGGRQWRAGLIYQARRKAE